MQLLEERDTEGRWWCGTCKEKLETARPMRQSKDKGCKMGLGVGGDNLRRIDLSTDGVR